LRRLLANFSRASAAVTAATIAVASTAWAAEIQHEEKRTIDVKGKTTLIVQNARGKAVVVGTSNDQIRILATKRARARDAERAQRLIDKLEWVVDESDEALTIETRHSKALGDGHTLWAVFKGGKERSWIDYAIEVPRSFAVEVVTTVGEARVSNCRGGVKASATSGDIFLSGILGNCEVELTSGTLDAGDMDGNLQIVASSGSIDVHRVSGRLVVRGTSGDVDVSRVGGDVDIRLSGGDLRLDSCLGDLVFMTSTGDAAIAGVEGSINAVTSSGDLEVMILPVGERDFRLSSSSGDIGVTYNTIANAGFQLDISTSSGSIEGDIPIKLEEITRRRLRGIVGTGKSRVVIETASGDVRVFEKKSAGKKEEK